MQHFTREQWHSYLNGSEIERHSMEAHLEQCEDCLELYLSVIESGNAQLIELTDVQSFADAVLKSVESKPQEAELGKLAVRPSKRRWFERPIVQYTIAASITIILVGSGAFQQLIDRFADINQEAVHTKSPAISEQLTNKAGEWLDSLPAKHAKKEGKP